MVAYFNPHTGFKFHLYIWILILLNSMVSYEAKELLTVKKICEKRNWQCFISQWIWIEMGFKFTYKSVCCALGGCRCVVKSCLSMVASGLGLRLYLEKHLREREREREREDLESLHRSVSVTCSCLCYFCGLLGFCIRC